MTQSTRRIAMIVGLTVATAVFMSLLRPHATNAQGATCDVPGDPYPTIQSAVDDAQCEIVNLTASFYAENVVITRSVSIGGQGEAATTVDGAGLRTVFAINTDGEVNLEGMTITNGANSNGGGIYNDGASLTLRNSVVSENNATENGAGIYHRGPGRLTIIGSTFSSNLAGSDEGGCGGAIYNEAGIVWIRQSQLVDNDAGIYEAIGSQPNGRCADEYGGAIYNQGGTITIWRSTLSNNVSKSGGGIYNDGGTLNIRLSTFSDHLSKDGFGGALLNLRGRVRIVASDFNSNTSDFGGGAAIGNQGGEVRVIASTFEGNFADDGAAMTNTDHFGDRGRMLIVGSALINNQADYGDAIYNTASITITTSTISNSSLGAALYHGADGQFHIASSTLSGTGGSIIENAASGGVFEVINTIIAAPAGEVACEGEPITSLGHNIATDVSCNLTALGDQPNTEPLLGPLQDNGGPTWTHSLLAGSPAIDMGDNEACPRRDQRGVRRPQDGDGDGVAVCDNGAYEAQP